LREERGRGIEEIETERGRRKEEGKKISNMDSLIGERHHVAANSNHPVETSTDVRRRLDSRNHFC
jgi:hypothetical protein